MVKLIRLKGDSTKNNKEVRNIFSDTITLGKNSRIALRSCKVDFLSGINAEEYDLTADGQYTYSIDGLGNEIVTVASGVYTSANALVRALQISANSSLVGIDVFDGVHNIWKIEQDRALLEVYRGRLSNAGFSTDWQQTVGDGSDLTLTSTTITSAGAEDNQLILPQVIPLVNAYFEATVNSSIPAAGAFSIGAVRWDNDSHLLWGMEFDKTAGEYNVIVDNVVVYNSGVARISGDNITIGKYGDKVYLTVLRSAGDEVISEQFTLPATVLNVQSSFWRIAMDENSSTQFSLNNCECIALEHLNPTLTLTAEVPVDVKVNFGVSNELSHFLGFPDKSYENQGQPAIIRGERNIKGILTYSGIMLNIIGLDLDSYTGASDKQPRNLNILDVLYPNNTKSSIEYIVNDPLKLNVKNSAPMGLRDLTMSFVRDDTGALLEFIGTPIIVLEVYDEDES